MKRVRRYWRKFWMKQAGLGWRGRWAARLAGWGAPPYKARVRLAKYNPQGYVSPQATIHHPLLQRAPGVFIGDRVTIFQSREGGEVILESGVHLYSDIIIETGAAGRIIIGAETHVQPRCQFSAYKASIEIGRRVEIAPNCSFYPYNHAVAAGLPVREQPLTSSGPIIIGDDVWLGVGVIVLEGVRIGRGAVIGAGAVVTQDIPANGIAVGVPARVVRLRE